MIIILQRKKQYPLLKCVVTYGENFIYMQLITKLFSLNDDIHFLMLSFVYGEKIRFIQITHFRNKDNTIIKYTSIIVLTKKIILQM